jgi:putative transposase
MTNHAPLLMTPRNKTSVSQLMQALGRYYVRYINQTYQRTGTLWEGRFKSALVDSENYFLIVSKYIELNSIRAGMVKHPAQYPWPSFKGNATYTNTKLLTPHLYYQALGNNNLNRQAAYRTLFNDEIPEKSLLEIRD